MNRKLVVVLCKTNITEIGKVGHFKPEIKTNINEDCEKDEKGANELIAENISSALKKEEINDKGFVKPELFVKLEKINTTTEVKTEDVSNTRDFNPEVKESSKGTEPNKNAHKKKFSPRVNFQGHLVCSYCDLLFITEEEEDPTRHNVRCKRWRKFKKPKGKRYPCSTCYYEGRSKADVDRHERKYHFRLSLPGMVAFMIEKSYQQTQM